MPLLIVLVDVIHHRIRNRYRLSEVLCGDEGVDGFRSGIRGWMPDDQDVFLRPATEFA